jgi:hypothetical protein
VTPTESLALNLQSYFHYSFLDDRLFGGERISVFGNEQRLADELRKTYGIAALINLLPPPASIRVTGMEMHPLPIEGVPPLETIEEGIRLIGTLLGEGKRVLIFCNQGLDRTGCLIGAYLAHLGQPPEDVFEELLQRFPPRRRQPQYVSLWAPYREVIRGVSERTRRRRA